MSGTGQALDNNSKISEAANLSAVKSFIKPFLPNHQIEGLFNPFIFILFILKLRLKNNIKYPIFLSDFVPNLSTSHLLQLLFALKFTFNAIAVTAILTVILFQFNDIELQGFIIKKIKTDNITIGILYGIYCLRRCIYIK
jgi:hypothetical protein